jgi:arylsulfatase A-like enzyme
MMTPIRRKNLLLGLVMGLLLMLLSYVRIVGDSKSMAFREEVLETIFKGSIMGTTLMWNLIWFGVALAFLHMLFGAVCWGVGVLSAGLAPKADSEQPRHERQHMMLWFAFLTLALMAFNAAVFSRSSLGSPYAQAMSVEFLSVELGLWVGGLVALAAASAVILALFRRWRAGWRPLGHPRRLAIGLLAVALPFAVAGWATGNHSRNDASRTNVILIGIDSLRLDIMSQRGPTDVAPHMREFLNQSVWFTDTMTPLARTFPSVMSILTGRQPHKTGAYMNLPPRDFIREGDTLGRIFSRAGYHSAFAMDEVRFANIDTSYGFDQAITPPAGATEFLLSLFADTPLSNFVVNSRMGSWLFPYVHANRGAAATYDPDTFVDRLERELAFDKPLLLATHLTLSHWPYTWADAPLPVKEDSRAVWPQYYIEVIRRVDQQFADLMSVLRERGVLDNAIVVLYSDHGESFGKHSEALVPDADPLIAALAAVPQWGHGSTVLTAHQYKVVLGMRAFGAAARKLPVARQIAAPASVMDIAPTLTQLAGVSTDSPFDGVSLVPLFAADAPLPPAFAHRVRFTETEFTPVGVATPDGKMSASGIARAAEMYDIDPVTDRVEVRHENVKPMLGIRQYAAVGDEFLLAALPFRKEGLSHMFVLISKNGSVPQLLASAPTPDAPQDLHRVWDAMQANFEGIVPTAAQIESGAVSETAVARRGRTVTSHVTK